MLNYSKKIADFKTIWIRYDDTCSDRHQLYFKEHSIRNQEPKYPKGKTLFVLNIPPYATDESIKRAFSNSCGTVKSVTFVKNGDNFIGFQNGYVVFLKEHSLKQALNLHEQHIITLSTKDKPLLTGIEKWCKNYNDSIKDEKEIKNTIDIYMKEYDEKIAQRLAEEKAAEETIDSEGWTAVTGRKKRGQFALARKESTIQKVQLKEEGKKHKKQLLNFYTFQIREAKKQNLADLRKKFELDKQKLEQIKSRRKFKPF